MWFILGQITASSDAPFQPPGNTWTLYSSPLNNAGDVLYSRAFDKWYLAPRASGNVYYSSDGLTWTSSAYVGLNAGLLREVNGQVVVGGKYNDSGQPNSTYWYSTNGTNFGSNSITSGATIPIYSSSYGVYLSVDGVSNIYDYYYTASSLNGSWTTRYKAGMSNDMFGGIQAGNTAWVWSYDDVYGMSSSTNLDTVIPLPDSNISRSAYNDNDSSAYLWQSSISADNKLWKFNGTTFTAISTFDRPTGTSTWEAGNSIGIVDEELIEDEYLANWASGYISTDVARLFTPTHGYKYVASYYPEPYGADYSPDANMYITRTGAVSGNYYLIRSTDG